MKQIIVLMLLLIVSSCNNAQNKSGETAEFSSVQEIIQGFKTDFLKDLENDKVTGLSLTVVNRDSVIWNFNYGFADKADAIETSSETKYLIGSVTKVFTAISVMQLHEAGKLHIDSSFQKYVPEFAMKTRFGDISEITIRQILTHHSGLPEDIWLHKFSKKPPHYSKILALANGMYTTNPPGEIMIYSNLGYALLGLLVEKVSNTSYTEYISTRILKPLGMNDTGFFTDVEQQGSFSKPYDAQQVQQDEYPLFDLPAGAVISTTKDMAKFVQALIRYDERLISEETLEEMYRIQNMDTALDLDDRTGLCFGISNKAMEAGRIYEHGGSTLFHRAQIYIAPDCGLAAVVLSNSEPAFNNIWKVKEILMAKIADFNGFTPDYDKNPYKEVHFSNRQNENLSRFAGYYAMPGITYQMQWKHDMLFVDIQDNKFYLKLADEHTFHPAKRFLFMNFAKKDMWFFMEEINGQKLFIEAKPWGDLVILGQQVEQHEILQAWKNAFGIYRATNYNDMAMAEELTLTERDGFAVMEFNILGKQDVQLGLKTITENEAVTMGLGRMGGETVFLSDENNINYILFKGAKFKKQ
ncbi:MAG TPA: serine hydrolase domain-containing protein [Phaeodactylibacter sp.]|nr:serine hydrolase domain-containing protein [Phaeodactylibacter sp.]